ncbi:hypothetical protein T440DRAFT_536586 [Plenodomus tracheiphilus IPT5]|uniref:Uncharacterized protein n=1 Tax=Plenodomus tracheiphilus IPT5 TaxID=1408161 RepID=A0A6A7AYK1_9PLEO|nr:hypothetical protein T440DRAFT_536586 [Plenodomus tracheiphilus IPT5]
MSLPISTEQQELDERAQLSALLKHKLRAIPPYHLPTLTINDIILQTPTATHIPNIPTDIQLPFFLRHRALLARDDDRPLKSEKAQNMNLTRAIWFYRLDSARQFQRYHDGVRWNLAIYTALLAYSSPGPTLTTTTPAVTNSTRTPTINNRAIPPGPHYPPPSRNYSNYSNKPIKPHSRTRPPQKRDTYIPLSPSATRFITMYLSAVLEHHNTPHTFHAREIFLKSWKATRWDLFTITSAAQKKVLKGEMKRLAKEWDAVLDAEIQKSGRVGFERGVGRFVGGLVPGRRAGGGELPSSDGYGAYALSSGMSSVGIKVEEGVEEAVMQGVEGGGNELLDALRVPFHGQGELGGMQDEETSTVAEARYAISVVQRMGARDIMPVLMRLFPGAE